MSENNIIGRKLVLWRREYKRDAYEDQFGLLHEGWIVLEQIPITITEVRNDVPAMFGETFHQGLKAISKNGEVFTCNWDVYPDDTMTPTFYWDCRKDERGLWTPEDGVQAYNFKWVISITPDGKKAVPLGAKVCKKHDYAYLKEFGCYLCKVEK